MYIPINNSKFKPQVRLYLRDKLLSFHLNPQVPLHRRGFPKKMFQKFICTIQNPTGSSNLQNMIISLYYHDYTSNKFFTIHCLYLHIYYSNVTTTDPGNSRVVPAPDENIIFVYAS